MALGIYKPGQGYWMRVLTAVGVGALFLAAAVWGWKQAQAVRLPAKHWTFSTSASQGEPKPGDTVTLLRFDAKVSTDTPVAFGSGSVEVYHPSTAGRGELVVNNFDSPATRDQASDTTRVLVGDADSPAFQASVVAAAAEPVFPQLYLQAGIACTLVLVGLIVVLLFVATTPSTADFLIATDSEMKKVNWSTYKQIKGSTIVVIVASFLIAGILFLIDIGFSSFFRAIHVLQGG